MLRFLAISARSLQERLLRAAALINGLVSGMRPAAGMDRLVLLVPSLTLPAHTPLRLSVAAGSFTEKLEKGQRPVRSLVAGWSFECRLFFARVRPQHPAGSQLAPRSQCRSDRTSFVVLPSPLNAE